MKRPVTEHRAHHLGGQLPTPPYRMRDIFDVLGDTQHVPHYQIYLFSIHGLKENRAEKVFS